MPSRNRVASSTSNVGAAAPTTFSMIADAMTTMPNFFAPIFCMMAPAGRAVKMQVKPTTDISRPAEEMGTP